MGSVNKVILVGNLGADPEIRYTAGGQAVANLRIATTERFQDKDGNLREKTEWHRIVVWGKQAEHCKQYLGRGRQIYVEGSLETREWTDKDGVKRYTTEVKARQVVFLGGREGGASAGGGPRSSSDQQGQGGGGGWDRAGGGAPPQRSAPPAGRGAPSPSAPSMPEDEGYFPEQADGISDDDIPF